MPGISQWAHTIIRVGSKSRLARMTHLVRARRADSLGGKVRFLLDRRVDLEGEELFSTGRVRRGVKVGVDLVSEAWGELKGGIS